MNNTRKQLMDLAEMDRDFCDTSAFEARLDEPTDWWADEIARIRDIRAQYMEQLDALEGVDSALYETVYDEMWDHLYDSDLVFSIEALYIILGE